MSGNNFGLLGPRGLPMVELSGARAWKQYTKRDVVASLQWIDVRAFDPSYEHEGPQPCMCLHHAHRRVETGSYVIPQSNAFHYVKTSGNSPSKEFAQNISKAVTELGFDANDRQAWTTVFDIVLEAMADLIRMPSEMPDELHVKKRTQGIEITVRHGTETIHQEVQ